MRFMAEVYGVSPYGANGDDVVRNYVPADGGNLVTVANGTVGRAPLPGDVISFDSTGLGHVAVVAASNVDAGGNGAITLLSQNDTPDGWRTLAVSHWVVASFGSEVPYGWLHDPAGRGAPKQSTTGPGYWMLGADGVVYAFGGVGNFGATGTPAAAIAPRTDGAGYWIVDTAGNVRAFGTSTTHGAPPRLNAGEAVTTIAATPSGNGYWLFTNRGRAFALGDARWYGDMTGHPLNGGIVASAATSDGRGYYMVGSDGGIFSFGDAAFHGSMGAAHLNAPVVGIAPTPDGAGYWLVASDGGVFAFAAPFRGSMGSTRLNRPIDGMVAFGNGYLMVASDGGTFDFSNQAFYGSLGGNPPVHPVIGVAVYG
jgi:ribosomal protein L24E